MEFYVIDIIKHFYKRSWVNRMVKSCEKIGLSVDSVLDECTLYQLASVSSKVLKFIKGGKIDNAVRICKQIVRGNKVSENSENNNISDSGNSSQQRESGRTNASTNSKVRISNAISDEKTSSEGNSVDRGKRTGVDETRQTGIQCTSGRETTTSGLNRCLSESIAFLRAERQLATESRQLATESVGFAAKTVCAYIQLSEQVASGSTSQISGGMGQSKRIIEVETIDVESSEV